MAKYQVNIDKGFRGVPLHEVIEVEDGDVEAKRFGEIGFLIPIFDVKTKEDSATSATGIADGFGSFLRGKKPVSGGE